MPYRTRRPPSAVSSRDALGPYNMSSTYARAARTFDTESSTASSRPRVAARSALGTNRSALFMSAIAIVVTPATITASTTSTATSSRLCHRARPSMPVAALVVGGTIRMRHGFTSTGSCSGPRNSSASFGTTLTGKGNDLANRTAFVDSTLVFSVERASLDYQVICDATHSAASSPRSVR